MPHDIIDRACVPALKQGKPAIVLNDLHFRDRVSSVHEYTETRSYDRG